MKRSGHFWKQCGPGGEGGSESGAEWEAGRKHWDYLAQGPGLKHSTCTNPPPVAACGGDLQHCPFGARDLYKWGPGWDRKLNLYVWCKLAVRQTCKDAQLVLYLSQPLIPSNFHFCSSLRRSREKNFWLSNLCLLFTASVQNGLIKKERKIISSFLFHENYMCCVK